MKICMFVYNNCKHDARVLKEAKSLAEAGYDVRIIAVLDKTTEPYEERDGFRIIRVVKDPLHYRILRGVKGFKLIAFLTWILHAIMQILLLSIKKLKKFLAFLTSTFVPTRNQSTAETHYGLMNKLKHAFQEIDQAIKEKGLKEYIRESVKTYPGRFLSVGWALVLGYYVYQVLKKVLYWGVRRPARILWYRYIKKVLYWGVRRPVRLVWSFLCKQLRNFLMIFHKPLSFLDYYQRSLEIVRQEPADIYHAHDLNTLPVAYWAKRLTGGKIVYDSHELYTETSTLSHFERRIFKCCESYLIHQVDKVITVNQSIASELSKRYKILLPEVIMNCPVINNQKGSPCENLLLKRLGFGKAVPLILYQGGYAPNRGLQNLILSAHYLNEGIIVLMGWGKLEQELKNLVKAENLNDKVMFLDPVPQEELLIHTQCATLGVIPYQFVGLNNYYTTPNKLFEYIAAGLPVVGSNFPELKRIIEGYNLGKTFDPEDPKDIAAAINDVLLDKARYEEMRKNALEAAKIFNWENESKKLLTIYRNLSEVIQNNEEAQGYVGQERSH